MEEIICKTCGTPALEKAIFCYQCGHQLRCKECLETLVEGAKHCVACGLPVTDTLLPITSKSLNSIKFKENKDERFYEIEFTNDVGKEIKEVIADLLKNKLGPETNQQLIIKSDVNRHTDNIGFRETKAENNYVASFPDNPDNGLPENEVGNSMEIKSIPDYPHLNDLEIKLDCRENEWLLLYAFYSSDYGTTTFTKEEVWQKYKNKRLTETRFKNLGTNWKSLFKKYICTVKENEFKFTSQGLTKAQELLMAAATGNKTANRAPRKVITFTNSSINGHKSLPVSRKVVANSIVADEFDVYKNDYKISLEDFFSRKKPGLGNPNRIVTIAYYITKINHQEYFTEGNIDYAYRILNLSGKPVHLKQVIINLKNDRIWFQKVLDGGTAGWRLTRQAEIYVEEKLPAVS
jgi:hypothetical protein